MDKVYKYKEVYESTLNYFNGGDKISLREYISAHKIHGLEG